MESKKSVKDSSSQSSPSRALYHVYQKLNNLRDLVAAGTYPNAAQLSERIEISLRTVKRYLDNLRECGAPL